MSPSERQRTLQNRKVTPPPKGWDAAYYGLLGRLRRGPWARKALLAAARRADTLRAGFEELKDGVLDQRLQEVRAARRRHPGGVAPVLEEGLALLAVVARRELGLSPYVVQLMASAALARGFLAEVDTGEGKTLALALTAAFNAWTGLPCHVITANDYLAGRDAEQLEAFYRRAGLSVGRVLGDATDTARRQAYLKSVTYTTAKEVAADHLRDRLRLQGFEESATRLSLAKMAGLERMSGDGPVQRGLHFALLDEADNSLIDEAVTPLIISRLLEAGELEEACAAAWRAAASLVPGVDYQVDHGRRAIEIDPGQAGLVAESMELPGSRLWASTRRRLELLRLSLEAREFFRRDEQYVLDEGKVVIVDEATGRPMPMRTWRKGLHQMIEAREGVPLSGASETMARVSFQAFFRSYQHLAGASGTVREVAAEIWRTYGVPTLSIPRNLPCQRQMLGHRFHAGQDAKVEAITAEIKARHARGQPVLVGIRSVEASETLAEALAAGGMTGHVLNARRHREEALVVMQAGSQSRITIATNMAGRGTDIRLGEGVASLGGLHVIASEPHESARVDRQLFGRAARHGDPGSVIAIYSAEDPLFVRFIPGWLIRLWIRLLQAGSSSGPGHRLGRLLLWWAQFRAQALAFRRRRQVMETEVELAGSLGFGKGPGGSGGGRVEK